MDAPEERPEPGGAEKQSGNESEAEAAESASEEGEATESPSTEEWLTALSPEQRNEYAKRYPSAWKLANDPNQPEDLRFLLRDKINSDIEIQQRNAAEAEDPLEYDPEAAAAVTPEEQRKQYQDWVGNLVTTYVDPQVTAQLGTEVLGMLGIDPRLADDPYLPDEDRALIRTVCANAPKLGATLARGAVDLFTTVAPHILPIALDQVMPGFREERERGIYRRQWESVRASKLQDGTQPYKNLPSYDSEQFRAVMEKAADQIPGFDDMVFTRRVRGRDGRVYNQPLPLAEQAARKYALLARAAARAAGKALGAGQSTQRFAEGQKDDAMDELDAVISQESRNFRPFAKS